MRIALDEDQKIVRGGVAESLLQRRICATLPSSMRFPRHERLGVAADAGLAKRRFLVRAGRPRAAAELRRGPIRTGHALRDAPRRCRTACASTSSTGSVCDQLRHASVIDTPYFSGTPGFRS